MSAQATELRLHASPKPYTPSRVMASPVTGLLVSGIVNPFGPTVNAVVAVGELKVGAKLPVVRLMLNPFQQEVEEVGTLTFGKTWRPSAIIPQLFELRAGCCPSLILPLEQLKLASAVSLFAEFLRGFDDARGVYDRVREYYGNPWDRVSREMSMATEHLTAPESRAAEEHEPLNEAESRHMAELLLADEHSSPEVQALIYAWNGSIQHIAPALATLPMDQFATVLEHICSAVRVPAAPPPSSLPSSVTGAVNRSDQEDKLSDLVNHLRDTNTQTPEEMMATVERLQREGRMPSLDQLLAALQGAIEEQEEPPARKQRRKK
jgi:hypothetical protein